jgi:PPE-repeat protein
MLTFIGSDGFVNLKVFNALGEVVTELLNQFQKAGTHQLTFKADNLPSGVYVYQLTSGNPSAGSQNGQAGQVYVESKKMMMMK